MSTKAKRNTLYPKSTVVDNKEKIFTNSYDFLQDTEFIQWRLFRTPASETYWQEFRRSNACLEEFLEEAILQFDSLKINQYTVPEGIKGDIYAEVLHQIARRKKRQLFFRLSSVAAVFLVALVSVLYIFERKQKALPSSGTKAETIVGQPLPEKEIQLVAAGTTLNITNQSEINLTSDGKVRITDRSETQKEMQLSPEKLNTLIVPYGKRAQISLSDGSKVWLNSGSVLEFPAQFSAQKREIRLTSGEIYIEVSPDRQKPFQVKTPKFNVRVYGTKFNVSSYPDAPSSVVLAEGCVGLQGNNGVETVLKPNERAVQQSDGLFDTRVVDVTRFVSWKDGYLVLDDTPISEVLRKIERYYNLSFRYAPGVNLEDRTCVGKIYLSDNLDNVMTTVALLSKTKYKRENNQIQITYERK